MATKEEAQRVWREFREGVQQRTPVRYVLTGNGQGDGVENLYVPFKPDHIYVREYSDLNRAFPVLNRGKVGPYINMPVVVGYDQIEPEREQVLGINYDALPGNVSTSAIYSIGKHHIQHEFGGGDVVWVDSRQWTPGLVVPTTPPSMNVEVRSFLHYYDEWGRFGGSTTDSLSQYKPADTSGRYVLVSLDQRTGSLLLKPGIPFTNQQTFDVLISSASNTNSVDYLPTIASDEIPLGAVYLTSATSVITWIGAGSNLLDTRLHNSYSISDIIQRLNSLEATLGNSNTLPTTGAANFVTPDYNQYLNQWQVQENSTNIYRLDSNIGINTGEPLNRLHVAGDVRIGEVNDLNTGTFPSYGRKLWLSGGAAGGVYNSEGSDPIWMARHNVSSDTTQLRVNIGDNFSVTQDSFVIGVTSASTWYDRFAVYGDGRTVFASPSATSANDLQASSLTFHVDEITNTLWWFSKYADGTTVKSGSVGLN